MRRVDFMVGARDFKGLKAEQFMQDAVYFYDEKATCEQLTREMTAGGFGSVPIVNEKGRVVGLVTEFDLLKAIMEEKSLEEITARDIMTQNPLTVLPDTNCLRTDPSSRRTSPYPITRGRFRRQIARHCGEARYS